jgi:hypothetical protein
MILELELQLGHERRQGMASTDKSGIQRPARVQDHVQVRGDSQYEEVWICSPPAWKAPPDAWSVKRGHRIPSGAWQRAGEVPGGGFPMQAIELAFEQGWYEPDEVVAHINRLLKLMARKTKRD